MVQERRAYLTLTEIVLKPDSFKLDHVDEI